MPMAIVETVAVDKTKMAARGIPCGPDDTNPGSQTPVLLVAALDREFSGLQRYATVWIDLQWPIEFAREAWVGGKRLILAANGPGPQLAGEAVRVVAERMNLRSVVSIGYCGALDPGLEAGDLVVPGEVISLESGNRFSAAPIGLPEPSGIAADAFSNEARGNREPRLARKPARNGTIVSGDRVISSISEKAELWRRTSAQCVEMEAAGVAAAAQAYSLPFSCLRVVSDTASEGFGIDLNQTRDAQGRFSTSKIVLSALRRPWRGVPELLRIARRSRLASARLGECLAGCRF